MCGIVGYIGEQIDLSSALQTIKHRGPDSTVYIQNSDWGVGVNRLSITSPSEKMTQPLWCSQNRFCFVFNGQVYNYLEIKLELVKLGHIFKTNCDSEILFYSFLTWGIDGILKCEGMFSFAIWDNLKKNWIIARDPLGIKPLYYYCCKRGFYFASEIRALLPILKTKLINFDLIPEYLSKRYIKGSSTLFKNISKVSPGEIIEIDSSLNLISKKYFQIENSKLCNTFDEKLELFNSELSRTVNMTFPKDVSYTTLLSGGLDSSIITLFAKSDNRNLESYFYDNGYDDKEKDSAKFLSNYLDVKLNQITSSKEEYLFLPEAINALEEPIGDFVIAPNLNIFKEIKNNYKVVISGEGADELLGGYAHHFTYKYAKKYSSIFNLKFLIDIIPIWILNKVIPYPAILTRDQIDHKIFQLVKLIRNSDLSFINLFSSVELLNLNQSFQTESVIIETFDDLIKYDLENWLPNYNLLRLDKLAMSQSIELRVPYLNYKFINLCKKLTADDLIYSMSNRKYILQETAYKKLNLPKRIAYRKKHPFTFKESFLEDRKYNDFYKSYVDKNFFEDFGINRNSLENLIESDNFLSRKRKSCILNLAIWKNIFF